MATISEINPAADGSEGDGVVIAGPSVAYNNSNRILERVIGEYPWQAISDRYSNRFLESTIDSSLAVTNRLRNFLTFDTTPSQQDLIDWVDEFNGYIDDSSSWNPNDLEYLDQFTEDGILTYEDRDYWLTHIGDFYLSPSGRTFGVAAPSTLAEADPLNLRLDTSGVLRTDVIILDPNGANENTTATDAPVKITRASNNCTTPNGTAKSPASVWTTTGATYRYQFWTRFADLNEINGGSNVRFLDAPDGTVQNKTVTVYVRYGNHEQVREEILWRKRAAGFHAAKIIVTRYPTDARPEIKMGNSGVNAGVLDDVTPTSIGDISGGTARPPMITVGDVAGRERSNVNVYGIDFVGNRDLVGASGQMFSAEGFLFNTTAIGTNAIKYCIFRGFQFLRPDDYNAASFPDMVDTHFNVRGSNLKVSTIIENNTDGLVLKNNWFEPVPSSGLGAGPNAANSVVIAIVSSDNSGGFVRLTTDGAHGLTSSNIISISGHSGPTNGYTSITSVTSNTITTGLTYLGSGTGGTIRVISTQSGIGGYIIDMGASGVPGRGDNVIIRNNKFSGIKHDGVIRAQAVDNLYIGHNDFQTYSPLHVFPFECTNVLCEYNRMTNYGVDFAQLFNGGNAIVPQFCDGLIFRYNIVYNKEPQSNASTYGLWCKDSATDLDIHGNIFYRTGLYIDSDDYNDINQLNVNISNNLFVNFAEFLKIRNTYQNANILVNLLFWTDGNVTSSASSGGGSPTIVLTVESGHNIIIGDQLRLFGHSVAGYNGVTHTVTNVVGDTITLNSAYTSSGTGGVWYYTSGSLSKNGGTPGFLNDDILIDNNLFWRFDHDTPEQSSIESGPHLSVRTSSGSFSNYYIVGDVTNNFTNNNAIKPKWVGDPESGDFRIHNVNYFFRWLPRDMPFLTIQAWNYNPISEL